MRSHLFRRPVAYALSGLIIATSVPVIASSTAVAAELPVPVISGLKTSWRVPAGQAVADPITVTPANTALRLEVRSGSSWGLERTYTSRADGSVDLRLPAPQGVSTYRIVVPKTDLLASGVESPPVQVTGYRDTGTISGWDTKEAFLTKGTVVRDDVRAAPEGATAYVQRKCDGCDWENVSQQVIPADRSFTADLGKVAVGVSKYRLVIPAQPLVAKRAVSAVRVIEGYDKIPPKQLLPVDLNRLLRPLGIPTAFRASVSSGDTARAVCAANELSGRPASRREPSAKVRTQWHNTKQFRAAPAGMVPGINVSVHCQVAYFVKKGKVVRAVPVSTGRAGFPTDIGTFRIFRGVNGKETSNAYPEPHWNMYRSLYFNGGEAVHGSYSDAYVVTYPASHGCVRMLHRDVDWLWRNGWTIGTTVRVYGRW